MYTLEINPAEWSQLQIPKVDDEFEHPKSPTGRALVLRRDDYFDYEASLIGEEKLVGVRLWCS